jgi:glutamine cyclotransferase
MGLLGPAPGFAQVASSTPIAAPVPVFGYRVVAEYPHDRRAFTQGLAYVDGVLYEGTGLNGESTLRRVDLESGEVQQAVGLNEQFFGEGIAVLGDRIYQLTWMNGVCVVYDRETFEVEEVFTYSTQGWGLTTDGERLIMSDGTNRLYVRDPETFAELDTIDVYDHGRAVWNLNELEYVDGEIWANIWQTDRIARLDAETGEVMGWIDLTGLLSEKDRRRKVDVLNGIAHDPESDRVFVTGKLWPKLFEIELVPREE